MESTVSTAPAEAASSTVDDGLVVSGLSGGYGIIRVVEDVSLAVRPGQWVGLVGRNGAGKTTTVAAIAGLRSGRWAGDVRLDGVPLHRRSASAVARRGIAFVPDGHRVFGSMTVAENLMLGGFQHRRRGQEWLRGNMDGVLDLFPPLRRYIDSEAGPLSGGEQQMVVIGQALMSKPKVLILDEPSSALAPVIVRDIYRALEILRADGVGLLVVEQDIGRALRSVDVCLVMDGGRIVLSGAAEELRKDNRVADIVRGVD